jgi:hypothetical protein
MVLADERWSKVKFALPVQARTKATTPMWWERWALRSGSRMDSTTS